MKKSYFFTFRKNGKGRWVVVGVGNGGCGWLVAGGENSTAANGGVNSGGDYVVG